LLGEKAMTDPIEHFNTHQMDLKNRLNFFVQALFVLAAGSLSISIAVFTGSKSIALNNFLATSLGISWWCLVASIVLLSLMLSTIILRDYALAEKWRPLLDNPESDLPEPVPSKNVEIAIIVLGVLGLLTFIGGFVGLAYVATSIIGIT